MSALPNQVNYNEPLLRLPGNTTNFLAAALPTNGSKFGPGTLLYFLVTNMLALGEPFEKRQNHDKTL